ncbi:uncharacterized protein SPPG_05555 [Spizellomyces punctatus DAOM BR117]|uniref:WH2 domain-containing protein n=1 Tax=Spizellomyces punctatus (strain DAOM BR117) TaxID=645134 RepID=A0A0L0HDW7_SPIPD|nr:uncharacterized protein SPPG_05555 [Spizellomyces punctatus DAOM BR117]KNC99302.1 hypothetical protein SPPG_05555 [Spizellomyces punctatus DAOM BR117]|eukprot:XP_016607342.1 hypothetical protein SPPG_05555 [Spizellomyces punctatus DAOM BR117]
MPAPPPPPPPGPPPPPVATSAPPANTALLKSIQKGAKLKKVQTNDRSGPLLDAPKPGPGAGGGRSPPMPRPPGAGAGSGSGGGGGGAPMGGPAGLGGLFAGGMPKLRSTGLKPGSADSAPEPRPIPPKPKSGPSSPTLPGAFGRPPAPAARGTPPPAPARATPPPAPARSAAPPPAPPRSSEPTSPPMPRAVPPPVPGRTPPPPVPNRSAATPTPQPLAPASRVSTFPKTNAAPGRPAPPPPPGGGSTRAPPPPPPSRTNVKDMFERPPAPPAPGNRPIPPPPSGGLRSSNTLGASGFAAARNGPIKPSFSASSISSLDRRASTTSSGPQYETDGRWTFRTDLPPPRHFPSGASQDSTSNGFGGSVGVSSPGLGKRPPPPPPARRFSAAPPPPPSRSREGSVGQTADVTRYVDDMVPRLEQELARSIANADFMKCQKLKDATDQLNSLRTKAQGGTAPVLIMDEFRRVKSVAEALV